MAAAMEDIAPRYSHHDVKVKRTHHTMIVSHYDVRAGSVPAMVRPLKRDSQRDAFLAFVKRRKVSVLRWARDSQVPPNAIYNWLAGRSKSLSIATLQRLAKTADATIEQILGGQPHSEQRQLAPTVPLIDYVTAGGWGAAADPHQDGEAEIFITPDVPVGPNAFALEVQGDSMAPEFQPGDRIIVEPALAAAVRPGDRVVAKSADEDEATFKIYREGPKVKGGRVINLVPLNANYGPLTLDPRGNPGRIVGVVVEHHRYWRR